MRDRTMVSPSSPVSPVSSVSSVSPVSSPISASAVFAQYRQTSPVVRDADLQAVARNAKKKSPSAPPQLFNFLAPVAAVFLVASGAAAGQLVFSLSSGGQRDAAPDLHLQSAVSSKHSSLPVVGAPLALPSPPAVGAVAAVDAPPPSLTVALRASAAEQSPVLTDDLAVTELLECMAFLWGGGRKTAGGVVETRLKRRLRPFGEGKCTSYEEVFEAGKTFAVVCYKYWQWMVINEDASDWNFDSRTKPEVTEGDDCPELPRVKGVPCHGKTTNGFYVYQILDHCLAYIAGAKKFLALPCNKVVKGFSANFHDYCEAFQNVCPLTTTTARSSSTLLPSSTTTLSSTYAPNGTTTPFDIQHANENSALTNSGLDIHPAAIVGIVSVVIAGILLIVAGANKNIRGKLKTKCCKQEDIESTTVVKSILKNRTEKKPKKKRGKYCCLEKVETNIPSPFVNFLSNYFKLE
eukprot:GHVT01072772.1.p1 GENE.GHVT01072772.1~~GHVT01072772.1.p1  ORF type:complete len:464 (-),score=78.04 GHVT01072772.1:33-1424(-)